MTAQTFANGYLSVDNATGAARLSGYGAGVATLDASGNIASSVFDTDVSLAANSDTRIATQKAVKTYVDALATLVSGALLFKGAWDASSGALPGTSGRKTGWFYKVSVAGTVDGQLFTVGDDVYALVDNASTSTYAANWLHVEGSITSAEVVAALATNALALAKLAQGAALSVLGITGNAVANYADIVAALDGQVLRRSGTAIGFGAINLASANAVTGLLPFRGACVSKTSAQSLTSSTATAITWDAEDFDTDAIHDSVTNNTRLTVPSGVAYVEVFGRYGFASGAGSRLAYIRKNGTSIATNFDASVFEAYNTIHTGPIAVSAGDYFELFLWQDTGGALNAAGADPSMRFSMRIIG